MTDVYSWDEKWSEINPKPQQRRCQTSHEWRPARSIGTHAENHTVIFSLFFLDMWNEPSKERLHWAVKASGTDVDLETTFESVPFGIWLPVFIFWIFIFIYFFQPFILILFIISSHHLWLVETLCSWLQLHIAVCDCVRFVVYMCTTVDCISVFLCF